MSLIVDIHALQTIPPSLINRDDTGAPKTAIFGGVPRQRVSSQSWKRAIRGCVEDNVDSSLIGLRSKKLPAEIAKAVKAESDWDDEKVLAGLKALFKAAKITLADPKKEKDQDEETDPADFPWPETGYLLFLSKPQIERAAREIIAKDGEAFKKNEAEDILDTQHSEDIAMFGRMLADAPNYNVDAAVQVAHALSVHETQPEFDYFTAVDDVVEDNHEIGAGMIGTVQMMSSTLYRFAAINIDGLEDNLGSREAAIESVGHFIEAFVNSMPSGKQNTFANNTLPELVFVVVRQGRSVSLVNAFEEPITAVDGAGRRRESANALAAEHKQIVENYGFEPAGAFVVALGDLGENFSELAESTTLPRLGEQVKSLLQEN